MPIESSKIGVDVVTNGGDTQIGAGVTVNRQPDGSQRAAELELSGTFRTGHTTQLNVAPTIGLNGDSFGIRVGLEPTPLRMQADPQSTVYTFANGEQRTIELPGFTNGAATPVRDAVTLSAQATLTRETLSTDPTFRATPVLGAAVSLVGGNEVQGRLEAGARLSGDPVQASVVDGQTVNPIRGANGVNVSAVLEIDGDGVRGRVGNNATRADAVGAARQPLPGDAASPAPSVDSRAVDALRQSPLYQQALAAVKPADAAFVPDGTHDRLAAQIALQAQREGFSRISAAVPGQQPGATGASAVLFYTDGAPDNPASQRGSVDRFRAEATPVAGAAVQFAREAPSAEPAPQREEALRRGL